MQSKSILIVYCHPYPQSFNHAILTHLEKNLTNHGLHYQLIDLYGDHFQPFMMLKNCVCSIKGKPMIRSLNAI